MEFSDIKKELEKTLKPKRFKHSMNVVKEAARLSALYGENVQNAELAALLHDCAKSFKNNELISYAMENGLEIDEIQKRSPELLHGPVGAIYARKMFDIKNIDILNSIAFHTTGRANMSLLEKIIYLGDLTEEGRDFPALEEIRKISCTDLNRALILACNCTLDYVIKKDLLLHPLTIDLRNSLIIGGVNTYEQ